MRAVRLLLDLGYSDVVHLHGGMEAWHAAGLAVESGPPRGTSPARPAPPRTRTPAMSDALESLGARTVGDLARIWVAMIVGAGFCYWLLGYWPGNGLVHGDRAVGLTWQGLLDAVYFSGVTATSVGYGDILPLGASRVLAVSESVAELLIFGALVSKMVSRRQDLLMEEMNRNTFEDRLGRVRTNLHLMLMELQTLGGVLSRPGAQDTDRMRVRLESIVTVFGGEVRSIHDLLYGSYQEPEEAVLAAILDSLAAVMGEMADIMGLLPQAGSLGGLRRRLESVANLTGEICGECVPRRYAQNLQSKMDEVQALGHRLSAFSQ